MERLGGGSIENGPTTALLASRRNAKLDLLLAGGGEVRGIRLLRGVVYSFAVASVLRSTPPLAQIELYAMFEEM